MTQEVESRLLTRWFACRITSGKKSAQYGIRFSYPLYILIVSLGILLKNPTILSIAVLIAALGIILPMHPFDYIYNLIVIKIISKDRIPGRGTELQVNSSVAFVFTLGVIGSIYYNFHINYTVMAIIYVLCSIFFITIQLVSGDFSIYKLLKRSK